MPVRLTRFALGGRLQEVVVAIDGVRETCVAAGMVVMEALGFGLVGAGLVELTSMVDSAKPKRQ